MRSWRVIVGVATTAVLAVVPATAYAARPECKVERVAAGASYNSKSHADALGTAIAEATAGETLQVIGTCRGNFVIDKSLTLQGREADKHVDSLDGNGSGTVLTINGGRNSSDAVVVAVRDLAIANGETGIARARYTDLTIDDSTITANTGWGVRAEGLEAAPVTVNRSSVSGNGGGGIFVRAFAFPRLTLNDSTVAHNGATGIAASPPPSISQGTGVSVTLNRSSVVGNNGSGVSLSARDFGLGLADSHVSGNASTGIVAGPGFGSSGVRADRSIVSDNGEGGIRVGWARLTLTDSTVSGNSATGDGGGIAGPSPIPASAGGVMLTNTDVRDNHAAGNGGGIYSMAATLVDSTVSGNTAGASGGGIYLRNEVGGSGTFFGRLGLTGSTVTGNTAGLLGGGIFAEPGATFTLDDASEICGNTPDDAAACLPGI